MVILRRTGASQRRRLGRTGASEEGKNDSKKKGLNLKGSEEG